MPRRAARRLRDPFPIVALGCSAGGLGVLRRFFSTVPADSGAGFVVLQHLDPTRASLLAEILGRDTAMPVSEIDTGTVCEPDRVYVLPPDRYVAIERGVFRLQTPGDPRGRRHPVDVFFRSLAADAADCAVCVVLSGAGANGSSALQDVKALGGVVFVQDPQEAEHDGMPRAAIATGMADQVLGVEELPAAVLGFVRHRRAAPGEPLLHERDGDGYEQVITYLRSQGQLDLRRYKKGTLSRRIERRMGLHQVTAAAAYLAILRKDPREIDQLSRELLIKVTRFFREPEVWQRLAQDVLPELVGRQSGELPVRAWVVGCATGEEAYTLAIALAEAFAQAGKRPELQIFASDLDREAINRARAGLYPEAIAVDVSPERLDRWFVREDRGYRVVDNLRDRVVFALHDVAAEPPFSHLDLITCRNLLIYLEPDLQERIVALFHFGLRREGYLQLGSAETIGRQTDLFEPVSKRHRLYRRIGPTRHDRVEFPLGPPAVRYHGAGVAAPPLSRVDRAQALAQQLVLDRFTLPTVVTDRRQRILYMFGHTDRYLTSPKGELSPDLTSWLPRSLRSGVRQGFERAVASLQPAVVEGLTLRRGDQTVGVRCRIEPVTLQEADDLVLVAFGDHPVPDGSGGADATAAVTVEVDEASEGTIRQLEDDLQLTRSELRSTVEQLESANEEYRATNEEITSINEELQSTNEELETSKEELQSINEELASVNQQLEVKNAELERATDDLRNLLVSTDIATLFLDRELRIQRFTPAITRLMGLIPGDVGRPLHDIRSRFAADDLPAAAREVLRSLVPAESEVESEAGAWLLRRILPYRTEDDRIEGVVVTLTDITRRREAERELEALAASLERRVRERSGYLELLRDLAVIANQAETVDAALREALIRVCEHTGWLGGGVYLADDDGRPRLHLVVAAPGHEGELKSLRNRRQGRDGHRARLEEVLRSGGHRWSKEPGELPLAVTAARRLGLAAVWAYPLLLGSRSVGLVEFYLGSDQPPDPSLEKVLESVSSQIGRVIERQHSERELTDAVWAEQRKTAEELHDSIGQILTALTLKARRLERRLERGGRAETEAAADLVAVAQDLQQRVRALAAGLHPIAAAEDEGRGLVSALEDLCRITAERFGIGCELACGEEIQLDGDGRGPQLFQIAREAVTNAARHGQPTKVAIRLGRRGDELELRIEDDGDGFADGHEPGLGLRIMRYRAGLIGGRLEVEAPDGGGAAIVCRVPLEPREAG